MSLCVTRCPGSSFTKKVGKHSEVKVRERIKMSCLHPDKPEPRPVRVRLHFAFLLAAIVVIAIGLIALNACGTSTHGTQKPISQIQHVVVIFQENRTPDNLFQDPVLISRGADIASSGTTSTGQVVQLQPAPLDDAWDMGHSHQNFLTEWNNGGMNGFDRDSAWCAPGQSNCVPPYPEYYYVQDPNVQPYYTLAETYAFADHMFQTNQGPSFPAHQYIIAGTSAMTETSIYDMAENPTTSTGVAGCIAPPSAFVTLIDTTNPNPNTNMTQTAYPCTEHRALTDVLDTNNLNWKYYTPYPGSIWTGPNAIQHMCGPDQPPPNGTVCQATEWTDHVVLEGQGSQIVTDIQNGQLAAVTWVIPDGTLSDHPMSTGECGPSWVAAIVNAVGNSQFWNNTAIIITWDDWGGWYDHVTPPQPFHNSYEIGFRVPMIVVSPYAKAQYISTVNHDFGSILKFVESVFGLPEIDPVVGFADSRADDLSDIFNFNQTPLQFTTISYPSACSPSQFLNRNGPPTPPDND